MPPSSGEIWGHHLMPHTIMVDCLLPTGVIVQLNCPRNSTLESIKDHLWVEAKKRPLYRFLSPPSTYVLVGITQDAEREEFYDESRRLCDLRLFQPLFKVIEPAGNKEEKMLNYDVGVAVGLPVHDLDDVRDPEVVAFRRSLMQVCRETVELRDGNGFNEETQAYYVYPPEVESSSLLPPNVERRLDKGHAIVCVWMLSGGGSPGNGGVSGGGGEAADGLAETTTTPPPHPPAGDKQKYTLRVPKDALPAHVVAEAIIKETKFRRMSKEQQQRCVAEHQSSYLLKVCGTDEYLLSPVYPITQYKYVRSCIAKGEIPQLMLMSRQGVYASLPRPTGIPRIPSSLRRAPSQHSGHHQSSFNSSSSSSAAAGATAMSLWRVDTMLRIRILWATYVNVKEVDKIYVRTGIFHGTEPLCRPQDTEHVTFSNPKWDEWLDYEMYIPDIPRNARLCVSICSVTRRKRREEHCALAWGNVNLFDFRQRLLCDKSSLNLWPIPKGHDELLNPLGITGSNPNRDSPCLEIEFDRFSCPVVFPSDDQIEEYGRFVHVAQRDFRLGSVSSHGSGSSSSSLSSTMVENTKNDLASIREIATRDPLSEISEQEKELLWRHRRLCLEVPDSLPRLLDAVKWNSRDEVAQLYMLLKEWPTVSPQTALEMLDCKYADLTVRRMAVHWLDELFTDDKLSQYLLQLVQVLKYEPFLDNSLSRFLLKRALLNRKIGHFFFWHLKSEMHDPAVAIRFGMLLESFCRGIGSHLRNLIRQVEALEKLTKLTDTLRERKDDALKDRLRFMCDQISQADYLDALQNLPSPLNNSHILGNLVVHECKIIDSAKRPLWLVWNNPDPMAQLLFAKNSIIFKNGDDLRQDTLTLQVIRIMDNIWRDEGMDLRMLPYACLSTGKQVGMIEVVRNAKTVMGIQRKGGKMAAFQVDSTQLHKWIKEKNKSTRYEQAIETFTHSCAGYCVATFILGIGDRNPDNIMVNEEGQIFHIDFGHFLGHFKKKFGINRERVPFVLTEDFLYVIARGAENPKKSKEFESFQELCGKAYVTLRRHANILITLFTMMLSTGIPELQSMDDIGYLRKTLAVERSEEQALQYFQNAFYEAYGGAWTTKLDWFFHHVKHM